MGIVQGETRAAIPYLTIFFSIGYANIRPLGTPIASFKQ
jgi:hypothetical protein